MKLIFKILPVLVIFSSCQKVVDINLNDGGANLVIEAEYDATDEVVSAKLSYTTNYFGDETSPELSTATIVVEDGNGIVYPLSYIGESTYEFTGLVPEFETNYTMKVTQDGTEYTAVSFLAPYVALDTLFAEFQEASAFLDEGYIAYMGITDQPNYDNYYRGLYSFNGMFIDANTAGIFSFNDDFVEDNYFTIPFFSFPFLQGDTVDCELRCINEERSIYLSGLDDVISGNAAAPTNPTSNWSNGALGFFNVYSQTKKQIIIQ